MKSKNQMRDRRERRKVRIRKRIRGTDDRPRLSIFKSSKYTYCQVISDSSAATIVSASTNEQEVKEALASLKIEDAANPSKSTKSVAAARALGLVLAKRAKEKSISEVIFDRNGFSYAGRIKAVADGAREGGLQF